MTLWRLTSLNFTSLMTLASFMSFETDARSNHTHKTIILRINTRILFSWDDTLYVFFIFDRAAKLLIIFGNRSWVCIYFFNVLIHYMQRFFFSLFHLVIEFLVSIFTILFLKTFINWFDFNVQIIIYYFRTLHNIWSWSSSFSLNWRVVLVSHLLWLHLNRWSFSLSPLFDINVNIRTNFFLTLIFLLETLNT